VVSCLAQAAEPGGAQEQEPVAPTVMVTASTQAASTFTQARPDAYAPAGIMGDHIHPRGEWMIGYHFMHVYQAGLMDGSDSVSKEHAYSSTANGGYGYHNAPRDMRMDMHMIEVMRGVTDRLTVMVMAQYLSMAMKADLHPHLGATPPTREIPFTMNSNGIGDTQVSAIYRLTPAEWNQRALFNFTVSLPTGSITEQDDMPHGPGGMSMKMRMEYPMQLGSGTYDLKPGLTYIGQWQRWSWGGQFTPTFRLGENSEGYTLGNRMDMATWFAYRWLPSLSTSFRLAAASWSNIDGRDDEIEVSMSPAADPKAQGGDRIDAGIGFNLYAPSGVLQGHRLAVDLATPIYQRLDGPQLRTKWLVSANWQYAF
jgi:hypothetical protein